jgi:hypothetical protein
VAAIGRPTISASAEVQASGTEPPGGRLFARGAPLLAGFAAFAVVAAFATVLAGAIFFDGAGPEDCTAGDADPGCCRLLAGDEFAWRLCGESAAP